MFQNIISKLNDLRPRQLLLLAGGTAVLMFITLYAAMSFVQTSKADKEEVEKKIVETVPVVVAKKDIPARTRIQRSMLQVKDIPVEFAPEGSIKNIDEVLDVQVKISIFEGDIITIQKILSEKRDEGFLATIPLDSRAISISVNDITGVAGFAKPGDFVDLLLVERGQFSVTTSVLLQNVQLLSINKEMEGADNSKEKNLTTTAISDPSIATFALRPEDALKLISASKLGEIYMSLRPTKPNNMYVGEMEYTLESINTPQPEPQYSPAYEYAPEPEPAPPVEQPLPVIPSNQTPSVMPLPQIPATPAAASATPKIEIIQGDQVIQTAEEDIPPLSMPVIPSEIEAPVASPPIVSKPSTETTPNKSTQNTHRSVPNSAQNSASSIASNASSVGNLVKKTPLAGHIDKLFSGNN